MAGATGYADPPHGPAYAAGVRSVTPLIALALVVTGCGLIGGDEPTTTTTTAPSTTTTTLDAADIYEVVSPSIAFIETDLSTGSGVMVDPLTLVTNAHVVWPATSATVRFPNGSGGRAPIVGYDWMADLAIIDVGGLEGVPAPATFERDALGPGAAIYLVGYPADDPDSATPAITSGIVSRDRAWEEAGLRFVQSDALISGGQSGGALVDDRGRVVGISGLSVGDGFALALTIEDVFERLPGMRDDLDLDGLGRRGVVDLAGESRSDGSVPFSLDETVFVFDGTDGEFVSIEVRASQTINADLVGPDGFIEAQNDTPGLRLTLEAELVLDGPYWIVVYPEFEAVEALEVTGVETRQWSDPDHGATVTVGSRVAGNGDYPGDLDWFRLELREGQTVTVRATSANIDAALLIDLLIPGDLDAFASDSDTGGGVIGYDAEIVYTAPEDGTYAVAVFDETGFGPGGYVLTVTDGDAA